MDAGNMLKPMLARGELHCIGATTLNEYRQYIEKDAALERRFQPVMVAEPTVEDTISILRGLKERYEVYHGVKITDSALVSAAMLSDRYISDRFLPDKAIDLVDEACAMIKTEMDSMPAELDELSRRLMQMEIEEAALKKETDRLSQDRLADLQKELAELHDEFTAKKAQWENEKSSVDRLSALRLNTFTVNSVEVEENEFVETTMGINSAYGANDSRRTGTLLNAFDGELDTVTRFQDYPQEGGYITYKLGQTRSISKIRMYNTDGELNYLRDGKNPGFCRWRK